MRNTVVAGKSKEAGIGRLAVSAASTELAGWCSLVAVVLAAAGLIVVGLVVAWSCSSVAAEIVVPQTAVLLAEDSQTADSLVVHTKLYWRHFVGLAEDWHIANSLVAHTKLCLRHFVGDSRTGCFVMLGSASAKTWSSASESSASESSRFVADGDWERPHWPQRPGLVTQIARSNAAKPCSYGRY